MLIVAAEDWQTRSSGIDAQSGVLAFDFASGDRLLFEGHETADMIEAFVTFG